VGRNQPIKHSIAPEHLLTLRFHWFIPAHKDFHYIGRDVRTVEHVVVEQLRVKVEEVIKLGRVADSLVRLTRLQNKLRICVDTERHPLRSETLLHLRSLTVSRNTQGRETLFNTKIKISILHNNIVYLLSSNDFLISSLSIGIAITRSAKPPLGYST
jgi:hypothetical protein